MKPQLIVQDFEGAHNKDLNATRSRLVKGGSWKRQNIVVIIPAADLIPAKVALALWSLAFPPNNGVVRILAQGLEVGDAYSSCIEQVLAHPELSKFDFICTLEHDNAPEPGAIIKLIEHMENHPEFAWISGLYHTKFEGGVPQIWGDIKDPIPNFRPQPPDLNGGLVECYGTGMGIALWRMSMFKDPKLRKPWFVTQTKDGLATQDLYFAADARKYGYRCAVACDVKCGHYDLNTDTMW